MKKQKLDLSVYKRFIYKYLNIKTNRIEQAKYYTLKQAIKSAAQDLICESLNRYPVQIIKRDGKIMKLDDIKAYIKKK